MPVIKPRTRGKKYLRLVTRLEHETNETLHAYAAFLGEPVEYVLNELIDTVLAKDKDFVTWRADHPDSHVPRRPSDKGSKVPQRRVSRTREAGAVDNTAPTAAT